MNKKCLILAHITSFLYIYEYRVSQEQRAKLREGVPYVKLYRYRKKQTNKMHKINFGLINLLLFDRTIIN